MSFGPDLGAGKAVASQQNTNATLRDAARRGAALTRRSRGARVALAPLPGSPPTSLRGAKGVPRKGV